MHDEGDARQSSPGLAFIPLITVRIPLIPSRCSACSTRFYFLRCTLFPLPHSIDAKFSNVLRLVRMRLESMFHGLAHEGLES